MREDASNTKNKTLKRKLQRSKTKIKKLTEENIALKEELQILKEKITAMEMEYMKYMTGKKCSMSGSRYEKQVHEVAKNCLLNGQKFNTQDVNELGGSSNNNDIICLHGKNKIGIEIKKCKSPDWIQCSIKYNKKSGEWESSKNSKMPMKCRKTIEKYANEMNLFNGKNPPFMNKKITHEKWLSIKNKTNEWNDAYTPVPSSVIRKMYREKGCHYIQISNYGLYHLGTDICKFRVPKLSVDSRMRVRIKVHHRRDKNGHCSLSVTAAFQPIDIKTLKKSKYSLDDIERLPDNLCYKVAS